MYRLFVFPLIALAACSEPTNSANPFARAAGTYSEYMIDNQRLPVSTAGDTCHAVNLGGWLTLTIDGKYSLLWDQTTMLCGTEHGAIGAWGQSGTYKIVDDTVIVFTAKPPTAQTFSATFYPGNYTPEAGGEVPNLRFTIASHDYWAIEDVPASPSRR